MIKADMKDDVIYISGWAIGSPAVRARVLQFTPDRDYILFFINYKLLPHVDLSTGKGGYGDIHLF